MMMFFWVVVLIAIVALAWSLVQRRGISGVSPGGDRAEEVLRERYAKGEIDEATYQRMLNELRR